MLTVVHQGASVGEVTSSGDVVVVCVRAVSPGEVVVVAAALAAVCDVPVPVSLIPVSVSPVKLVEFTSNWASAIPNIIQQSTATLFTGIMQ